MNISKRYLRQPRGKGWTFKMETPKELIGVENPWSGVPFQKTIHIGLNTQDLRDAAQQRDLILAEITRLRRQVSGEERLSDARAIRWGEHFCAGLVEPVVRSVELANGEEVEEEIVIEHDLIEAESEQVARERGHAAAGDDAGRLEDAEHGADIERVALLVFLLIRDFSKGPARCSHLPSCPVEEAMR